MKKCQYLPFTFYSNHKTQEILKCCKSKEREKVWIVMKTSDYNYFIFAYSKAFWYMYFFNFYIFSCSCMLFHFSSCYLFIFFFFFSVTVAIISERNERLKLLQNLLEKKKMFESRLRNSVYSTIHGKDHDKLILCFTYLEMCGDNEDKFHIKPSLHKSLLTKLRSAMKSMNFVN